MTDEMEFGAESKETGILMALTTVASVGDPDPV